MDSIDPARRFGRIACLVIVVACLAAHDARAQEAACLTAADCDDNNACTIDECSTLDYSVPPPNCTGKLTAISFRYTAEGCTGTTNTQGGRMTCVGGADGDGPVRILIRDKNYATIVYGDTAGVAIGETAAGSAAAAGLREFKSESRVQIMDGDGAVLEDIIFHSSCSKPLDLGDRFGSLEVVSVTTTEGGEQSLSGICRYTAASCDDGSPCTDDLCDPEIGCTYAPILGCTSCMADSDCADGNACTTDRCEAGSCENLSAADCIPCTTASECPQAGLCMEAACVEGRCSEAVIPECGTCSTESACSDPNCADAPICVVEICGDCTDNDGDGLVDYEDPDCCAETTSLVVKRMKLRPAARRRHRHHLFFKGVYAPFAPETFNPLLQDTSFQIANDEGQIFCTTIPAHHWVGKHRRVRFSDWKARFANGLSNGSFRLKRKGRVVLRTHGPVPHLRKSEAGNVRVTVRVGGQCSQMTGQLRASKHRLVLP